MTDTEMQRVRTREETDAHEQTQAESTRVSRYVATARELTRSARSIVLIVVIFVLLLWTVWALAKAAIGSELNQADHEKQVGQRMDHLMKMVSALLVGFPVEGVRIGQTKQETEGPMDYVLRYTARVNTTEARPSASPGV
jgi:hypothetical protein